MTGIPLTSLQLTNQCVVVCDLTRWNGPESDAWILLSGSQEQVGHDLAVLIKSAGLQRLDDFGGVAETFLCEGDRDRYATSPKRTKPGAGVFSFTPKNRLVAEAKEMARVSAAAGYSLMILTVQKHGKYGKVWVLSAALMQISHPRITYYEDTNTVVDELKSSGAGANVVAIHVRAPGFEEHISKLADQVISQSEYLSAVLL